MTKVLTNSNELFIEGSIQQDHLLEGDSSLNPLDLFMKNYILHGKSITDSADNRRSWLKTPLKLVAIVVGGSAGLPWIEAGKEAGGIFHSAFISFMAAYGGVVTYGLTSIWASIEAVNNLTKGKTNEERRILQERCFKGCVVLFLSQLIGIVASIPTIYTAKEYNQNDYFILIASLVSYAFNSLGIYKLCNEFLLPFVNYAKDSHSLERKNRKYFLLRLDTLIDDLHAYGVSPNVTDHFFKDEETFYKRLMSSELRIDQNSMCKRLFRFASLFIFPLSNFWTLDKNFLNLTKNQPIKLTIQVT